MKPARKTRDFSIESILADKRVQTEKNCEDVQTECHVTNSKHFKECTTSSEVENCGANSELSKEHNFECENKLKTCDMQKCIEDAESDFRDNYDFAENRCKNFKSEFSRSKIGTPEVLRDIEKLEWLQCTRYKPPKIPRKPIGKNKRKPSFYPRIPFSMFQLEFLEQKFQNSAYLTRNDVMDISDILKLPPNRIKIWFQNRRARERREFCTDV